MRLRLRRRVVPAGIKERITSTSITSTSITSSACTASWVRTSTVACVCVCVDASYLPPPERGADSDKRLGKQNHPLVPWRRGHPCGRRARGAAGRRGRRRQGRRRRRRRPQAPSRGGRPPSPIAGATRRAGRRLLKGSLSVVLMTACQPRGLDTRSPHQRGGGAEPLGLSHGGKERARRARMQCNRALRTQDAQLSAATANPCPATLIR